MAGVTVRLNRAGIRQVVSTRMERVARFVANESARRVNVDTGNLRSSRFIEQRGTTARVGYRAKYAAYVHDGWHHHRDQGHYRGNPFLTSAVKVVLRRLARR